MQNINTFNIGEKTVTRLRLREAHQPKADRKANEPVIVSVFVSNTRHIGRNQE